MNEFFNLNEEEVENGISSLENILYLKHLKNVLYKDNEKDFLKSNDFTNGFTTRRDEEYNYYNPIFISPVSLLFLEAIFGDGYSTTDIESYDEEDIEEIYYNFRIAKDNRYYGEEAFDELGQKYVILNLKTDAIEKALKIADGNKTILDKIYYLALKISVNASDIEDSASINLQDYQVEMLLSDFSLYDIEMSACECLELELYCREVAYGKGNNRN